MLYVTHRRTDLKLMKATFKVLFLSISYFYGNNCPLFRMFEYDVEIFVQRKTEEEDENISLGINYDYVEDK